MVIPRSGRRTALVLIDVQKAFVTAHSRPAVSNIRTLIESVQYHAYVEAVFSAEQGSIWDRQTNWVLPASDQAETVIEVAVLLRDKRVKHIHKHTKSIFDENGDVVKYLRSEGIEELHLVGCDINDCVLATALDSFDRNFFTYVIEECCGASEDSKLKAEALTLLRHLNLTNNSQVEGLAVAYVPKRARVA